MGRGETDERLYSGIEHLKKLVTTFENGFGTLNETMENMLNKQDIMIEKQGKMLDKQDVMIEKQMNRWQDQRIEDTRHKKLHGPKVRADSV